VTSPCGSTSPLGLRMRIFLHAALGLIRTSVSAITFLPASLLRYNATRWYRNINLSSIDYAFRPRLRVRLTLGGFTVPRKPWVCGEQDSHLLSRYLFLHNHFQNVQASLPSPFTRLERSPTRRDDQRSSPIRSLGCALETRSFSARDLSISELLRTL
jgi:hypothetical protein